MELISSPGAFLNRLGMYMKKGCEPMKEIFKIYVVGDYRPHPTAKISERKGSCKFPADLKRLIFLFGKDILGTTVPTPQRKYRNAKAVANFQRILNV
jgi:hypothetical protein